MICHGPTVGAAAATVTLLNWGLSSLAMLICQSVDLSNPSLLHSTIFTPPTAMSSRYHQNRGRGSIHASPRPTWILFTPIPNKHHKHTYNSTWQTVPICTPQKRSPPQASERTISPVWRAKASSPISLSHILEAQASVV